MIKWFDKLKEMCKEKQRDDAEDIMHEMADARKALYTEADGCDDDWVKSGYPKPPKEWDAGTK